MMSVLGCIAFAHNPWLVAVAALVCVLGSWVTSRLYGRAVGATGMQRTGWSFLAAVTASVAIWCTHFIAMLGYESHVPVTFDPVLTILSLIIAVLGSYASFALSLVRVIRPAPVLGGALLGITISSMHYVGMRAYHVQGLINWNMSYVYASIVASVVIAALALYAGTRKKAHAVNTMAILLTVAIVALHFIGMTAVSVVPLQITPEQVDPSTINALGLAVAGMALVIAGTGFVSYQLDDKQRAQSIEELRELAMTDVLTGLPNRVSFSERLDRELEVSRTHGNRLAVVCIDLNKFKDINDQRGHAAGDDVLRALGNRLRELVEVGEYVARVGGDEFVATQRMTDDARLMDLLKRLEAALTDAIHFPEWSAIPGGSFGVAIYPTDAKDKESLISNADLAMYRAKSDLERNVAFYQREMDEAVRSRRALMADLRHAVDRDELMIHYQVQTSTTDGSITGYEALLRWQHPTKGFIPPSEFIPMAEESGLILQIGEWVLRQACSKAATWQPPYKIAVNLSAVQLGDTNFPALLEAILRDTGMAATQLELELTESAIFVDRERSLEMLKRIKSIGVSIALDDFGVGYSSLATLRAFPFDKIKLDRSFVTEVSTSAQATAIVRAVLALGKSLSIPILAEGIETTDQLTLLTDEGCDEVQGYLLGRPTTLAAIVARGDLTLVGDAPVEEVAA